jgi:hypothetical protein
MPLSQFLDIFGKVVVVGNGVTCLMWLQDHLRSVIQGRLDILEGRDSDPLFQLRCRGWICDVIKN